MEIHKTLFQFVPHFFLLVFTLALHNQHHVSGMSPNLLECSRHSKPKQRRAISCSLNKCVCCWFPSDGRRVSWYNVPYTTWGDDHAHDEGPAESRHCLRKIALLHKFLFRSFGGRGGGVKLLSLLIAFPWERWVTLGRLRLLRPESLWPFKNASLDSVVFPSSLMETE